MNLLVPDASVAAKWFLPGGEPCVPQTLSLLRRHQAGAVEFVVPDLFWAEFGNIAWKAVRRGRWRESSAKAAIQRILGYGLRTVPSGQLLEEAFEIAAATQQTVYDSLYVALAIRTRAELVTADERLANALAARLPVKWLGAFPQK